MISPLLCAWRFVIESKVKIASPMEKKKTTLIPGLVLLLAYREKDCQAFKGLLNAIGMLI